MKRQTIFGGIAAAMLLAGMGAAAQAGSVGTMASSVQPNYSAFTEVRWV